MSTLSALAPAPKLSEQDIAAQKTVSSLLRAAQRKARRLIEQGVIDAAAIDDYKLVVDPQTGEAERVPVEKPEGWTAKRFRVAKDMRAPAREMRTYLKLGAGIASDLTKIESAQQTSAPVSLNIGTVNFVAPVQYERVVIDAKE